MATKEVSEIRVNGKPLRYINGKKVNQLTINDTTYKLQATVNLIFNSTDGLNDSQQIIPVPKNSDITISHGYGSSEIDIYIDEKLYTSFTVASLEEYVCMDLDIKSITNIQEDRCIECKWGKVVGVFTIEETVDLLSNRYYIVPSVKTGTVVASYLSLNTIGSIILDGDGSTGWTCSFVSKISFRFKYANYSVFLNSSLHSLQGVDYSYREVSDEGYNQYLLTIVDNSWV